jgi:hypothetical protein
MTATAAPTAVATAPGAPPAVSTGPASPPARAEAAPSAAPAAAPPVKQGPGAASSAAAGGEPEVELLQRAQAALGADPARALALVREHEQRFPRGALGQEREVIAVGALVALGRTSEARARAARFVELFPRSAYRRRIEALAPAPAKDP